ncbi:MAG: N-acetylmuramoyl-L-alanine amidase [Oscillospiraceae bacterium]|nr:N-acetylmuramoyl-L-alanine amidase [Oscillospiraceae bacterium]
MKRLIIFILLLTFAISGCTVFSSAKRVSKAQKPILIIDPGHGGEDGGAVAADGTKESEINLAVALKMEALCGFLGIDSIMTRESEILDYPKSANTIRAKKIADQKARIELINSTPNAVLISVHQNTYPNAKPSGGQALYGKADGSKELAELIQNNISLNIDADNNRGAAKISDDIYLMKKADCPAVLVECGFMSNPAELEMLKTEEYQTKLAAVFIASYTQFISETGNYYG